MGVLGFLRVSNRKEKQGTGNNTKKCRIETVKLLRCLWKQKTATTGMDVGFIVGLDYFIFDQALHLQGVALNAW